MPAASHSRAPLFAAWRERYQIVRKIGAGGFADVYEALDLELAREVALKVVDERRGFSTRVLREVETAAALDHPGIVALYDFFTDGENSYLVWELVDGVSLAELGGELSDAEAVDAIAQLLDALAYAHSQGVVHRDIKPQNVMLDGRGDAKVMDFGIARLVDAETLTQEGDMLGTVAYMSPEQAEGRRVGPASDVYSAGVVLYELLAGVNPVRGATAAETISNVVAGRITALEEVRPDLPPELTDAVAAACARCAAERPPAGGLGEALRALAGRLETSRRAPAQRLLKPLVRSAPILERVVGALLASLAVAVLLERLPAYPQSWTLFLAVATALIWFVLPAAGLAWFLGTLAFPFFNVSLSLGALYIALSLVLFAAVHRRPVAAVLPALAPVLMPFFGTLLVPVGAALFGRWRGPLIAGWAALVTYVYLRLLDVPRSPFTAFAGRSRLADRLVEAGNPFTAAGDLLATAASPPALLQVALWAGLAFTLACVFALRRLEARLWAWAATFAGLFGVALIVPVEVWDRPAAVGPLLLATAVAAAVSGLVMVAVDPVRLDAPPLVEEADD